MKITEWEIGLANAQWLVLLKGRLDASAESLKEKLEVCEGIVGGFWMIANKIKKFLLKYL